MTVVVKREVNVAIVQVGVTPGIKRSVIKLVRGIADVLDNPSISTGDIRPLAQALRDRVRAFAEAVVANSPGIDNTLPLPPGEATQLPTEERPQRGQLPADLTDEIDNSLPPEGAVVEPLPVDPVATPK